MSPSAATALLPPATAGQAAAPEPVTWPATRLATRPPTHRAGRRAVLPVRGAGRRAARVRQYAITGGRTRSGHVLQVETFVATADGPAGAPEPLPEARAILELCRDTRSVAEVSALLRIPLGVVRVLLSDLADQGRIRVFGTGHGPGAPDRAVLERVLSGLRRL